MDEDFEDYTEGKLGLDYRKKYGNKFSILHSVKNSGAIEKKIFSIEEVDDTHGKFSIRSYPPGF